MLDHGQPTPAPGSVTAVPPHSPPLSSPSDLAPQPHPNPNLSGLGASSSPVLQVQGIVQPTSPPTLSNPKCSGYFVEPVCGSPNSLQCLLRVFINQMSWMEPFLEGGPLNGKILCPNKKCNAKLGNYDWAGVCCGCKEWVTPVYLSLLTIWVDLMRFDMSCRGSVSIGQKLMKFFSWNNNCDKRSVGLRTRGSGRGSFY